MTTGGPSAAMSPTGMRTFWVVWVGQVVSVVGSALTLFGLAVWVYLETGSATRLSMVLLAIAVPRLVAHPFAGALVDRWDRRRVMIAADAGAAVATLVIALLLATDTLRFWHLFPTLGVASLFNTLQVPAYTASITVLVPEQQYGRAAGLVELAETVSRVAAPFLAGVLLAGPGLEVILLLDVASFGVALATLASVTFPPVPRSATGGEAGSGIVAGARLGFRYLARRRGLLGLAVFIGVVSVIMGFVNVLFFPLVLGFAGEVELGTALSLGSVGMVAGGALMSAWGGPKRKIHGVLGFMAMVAVGLALLGLRPSLLLTTVALVVVLFPVPLVNGCNQAIFQAAVEPDVQGRVFAVRRLIAEAGVPVAYLLAGPVADRLFIPLLEPGGALAGTVGEVLGTGPERGIGLLFVVLGGLTVALVAFAATRRSLLGVEDRTAPAPATP